MRFAAPIAPDRSHSFSAWIMKPDKHLIAATGILSAAVCLIVLTWIGTTHPIDARRWENMARTTTTLANQTLTFTEQINRQILAPDQTLRILVTAKENYSRRLDLKAWRYQAVALNDLSRGLILINANGIIRRSSVSDAISQNASGLDYFHVSADPSAPRGRRFIGLAPIDGIMRRWRTNAPRSPRHPARSFAGPINADDRAVAIRDVFSRTDRGAGALMVLVDFDDGKLGGAAGPAALGPGASIIGCLTGLLAGLALLLMYGTRLARQREALMAEDRGVLAAANAELEAARALAAAKAEQLEATLAGMSDGISMVDSHLCLVEWNARFPDIAGVPAEILRIGLPMEEILRAQIRTGQFGWINDPDAEVDRRMARLRVAPFGVTQRQRPDGRTLELRRNRLPDGGFVTLYTDITNHKLAEEDLRQAKAAAETANAEKSSFVAIVSHEIRTPLNALLSTIRLLSDSVLTPAEQSLLTMARQSGEVLFGLINDILDISQMEAGKLSIRPSLFELRPLLETTAAMLAGQAAERGIIIRVAIAEATPATLFTDPGRLRQVQLNLLSNAVKYARSGEVWLTAEPGRSAHEAVRLTVKDDGPVIAPHARARLFRPFSRLDRPEGDDPAGTGLGLSICHHLVTLMGGKVGCDPWSASEGRSGEARAGNAFWITLPLAALPVRALPAEADGFCAIDQAPTKSAGSAVKIVDGLRRSPPRTRILLAEDIVANQLVTATLLRREGHQVDIVANGPAAIKAVQVAPYDLIFMDNFMPGMSGQEAAGVIRSLREPACSIPIVALTGNVSPEDEAAFKAAGMDGVLGKPVSLAQLLQVVDRLVWSARGAAKPAMPKAWTGPLQLSGPVPVLAIARINELRTNLPPETFSYLIEECLLDLDHRLPALRRELLAGAPAAVSAQAHAMIGMAASYGMAALEVRLRIIIAAARDRAAFEQDMTPFGPAAVTALEADIAEAARSLREMVRKEVA